MFNTASISEFLHDAKDYGFDVTVNSFSWEKIKESRDAYVKRLNGIYEQNLNKDNVEWIKGAAKFVSKNTIEVDGKQYTAKHILIAAGSRPTQPTFEGNELTINSDGFFDLTALPTNVAVVGGGYIAVELAGVFRALGSNVTIVIRAPHVLRTFDNTIQEVLMEEMRNVGVQFKTEAHVTKVVKESNGKLTLHTDTQGQIDNLDVVLTALGRTPNTDLLNIGVTGINADKNNHIKVDEYQNTGVEGLYALGDICGKAELTPGLLLFYHFFFFLLFLPTPIFSE